ncbi:MAG: FAD-dependent oxidoreductase [Ignavibacteriae bacterium HGW-Ignavibacteriae-3]|nr:MAG: FAD-dependent oxidoreductase [Ignavibacteriae bacterium HGW-Ignavibacteriae-3]
MKKKVVIIGGGFGGLTAAKYLNKTDTEIILIDKTNHHLFQPLLYQVATAALSPGDIAAPIRTILKNQQNVRVIMGEVINIDPDSKKVFLNDNQFSYDYLIVAVGSCHSYFGKDDWEKYAPGLKTISDALAIREKILLSFEKAERSHNDHDIGKFMTFVIVGGGPTGVELAGAIAEISRKTMLNEFRKIDSSKTKIILIEAQNRILSIYDPALSEKAKNDLESLGVTVRLNTTVTDINQSGVHLGGEFIETPNIIWAAGNVIPEIIKTLRTELDFYGRVKVDYDCSIKGHPEIFVIGDAALTLQNGNPLPGVAPVAIQQGKYIAKVIAKNIPKQNRKAFRYFDKGNLATIGRAKAIMQIGKFTASGLIAWLAWVFIHILYLIGFRNRYKVLSEWIWYYITSRQGIRLITNKTDL